ncbi:MAG: hypothetical protein DRI84_02915 [Bacteroidetes bacterium]|nr:MAG: hypothetical protein DRI84_02915 [Bacteroidota bacterium]
MPIDYEHPDEIVLGKNLKSGDCVRSRKWSKTKDGNDMGIIESTTFENNKRGKDLKSFYGKKPAYSMYDINCPSDGPYSTFLDPEKEFKVIRSRKDILYTYEKIAYQLMSRSADLMRQRNSLMDIRSDAIDRMNDRCDLFKEAEKKLKKEVAKKKKGKKKGKKK